MQQQQETRHPAGIILRKSILISTTVLLVLGTTLLLPSSSAAFKRPAAPPYRSAPPSSVAANEASSWDGDGQTTAPTFDLFPAGPTSQQLAVSPLFAGYYRSRSGATNLGVPLTAAFLSTEGWIQFFELGALLMPVAQPKQHYETGEFPDPLATLMHIGTRDPGTGILRLPVLQALLRVGSQVPVFGDSSLTYVNLRAATASVSMVPAPLDDGPVAFRWTHSQSVFVGEGTRNGTVFGHTVPLPIWSYIQRADVAPDGWQTDFGNPLTEALAFSVVKDGIVHRMLVQAFWSDAVVLDQSAQDASSEQPSVSRLESGVAYLRTLGPPPVVADAGRAAWTQEDTALLSAPGMGQAMAHIGQAFPLTLSGNSSWSAGRLWYQVQWTSPHRTFTGWADASALTFTSPGQVQGRASIDVLSPNLATYLAGEGGNVGVAVYDVTHRRYYTWNADAEFITGSSVKVPIMLTLLDFTEHEGREPNSGEMGLLTTMIENSNNDAAYALYNGEVGGADGLAGYMERIGVSGLDPDPGAFGWSLITPMTMVNLLTRLEQGSILTAQDRELALSLMENIEPDQQVGVGDTALQGATVAMKDGWVIGPDGLWNMNSSGIVTDGQQTYIIAVYTQDQPTLEDGQIIARSVCGAVAALFT